MADAARFLPLVSLRNHRTPDGITGGRNYPTVKYCFGRKTLLLLHPPMAATSPSCSSSLLFLHSSSGVPKVMSLPTFRGRQSLQFLQALVGTEVSSKPISSPARCSLRSHLDSNEKIMVGKKATLSKLSFGSLLFPIAFTYFMPLEGLAEECTTADSSFNMPLLFIIALVGAVVGGLLARQRKEELKRLNDQLRQINAALRRQAKIESYAPNLSYVPLGRVVESEVIVNPRKDELIANLKAGKNFLRNQDPEKAYTEFNTALELAKKLGDHIEQKKAARGLGASLQRQGKFKEAIKYHSMVMEISKRSGDESGNTEAYGAIADCYTELGDLEKAGKFYDKYISMLEADSDS